jgi:hypothetical protein
MCQVSSDSKLNFFKGTSYKGVDFLSGIRVKTNAGQCNTGANKYKPRQINANQRKRFAKIGRLEQSWLAFWCGGLQPHTPPRQVGLEAFLLINRPEDCVAHSRLRQRPNHQELFAIW